MALAPLLNEGELDALRQFDTCMVANAIETFNVRLHNTGFTDAGIRCLFKDAPPRGGSAATGRLRSGEPPMVGNTFHDRADFWNSILQIPSPRILVLEDKDNPAGRGAFVGDMHAAILKALGCIGYVTNGAVRELSAVHAMEIQLFAGNVAVSHAYALIFDIVAPLSWGRPETAAANQQGRLVQDTMTQNDTMSITRTRKLETLISFSLPAVAVALVV